MAASDPSIDRVGDGLDSLTALQPSRRPVSRAVASALLPKLVALLVLIVVWQLAVTLRLASTDVLPAPGDVWGSFADQWRQGHVAEAVATSMRRAATGYAISIAVGTPLGLLLARVRFVQLALGSAVSGLMSLPSVTWVPLGILWFGLSETTIYFVVVMGAFPSIANGTSSAIGHVPPLLLRIGDSIGARGWNLYRHVILPAAVPGYVAGLKQAWSFSWRSLMAAELITSSSELGLGLGQLLDSGRELLDMPLMMMSVAVILMVGIAVDGFVFTPLDRAVRVRRGLIPE